MDFIKTTLMTLLLLVCCILFGCATYPGVENFQLPKGYSLVETEQKFIVKAPDGNLTGPEWLTKEGAIGYAMSHDSFNKQ